jgi:ferredoxin-type protein NapH
MQHKPRRIRQSHAGLFGLLAALILIAAIAIAGFPQGFDQPSSFGESEPTREFETVQPDAGASASYFIHDQVLKIAIVGGLSILALAVLIFRGFRYRKWILLLPIGLIGFYLGGVLCPISSVQNIFLKWNNGYSLLFLIPVVLALAVGRVFCGYVCPFGAVQELLHNRKWAVGIPRKWRKPLGLIKYGLLMYLVTRVIITGTGIWQGGTPFKALFEWGGTPLTIALTASVAALSVILWRPFCEFFCPLGALLSLVSRFSLFRLEATASCVSCGLCTPKCPATACQDGKISSADCFLCGECVRACPATSLRLARRR